MTRATSPRRPFRMTAPARLPSRSPRLAPALLALAVLLPLACAPSRVSSARYEEHVEWLADDARQGRQTGTEGLDQTAAYVAAAFEEAGLEALGDGYLQAFEVDGNRVLLDDNHLLVNGRELELHEEWAPFPSVPTSTADGTLVFAGYGISDPDNGYDDYADLDVEGKVVVVLRYGPGKSLEVGDDEGEPGDHDEGADHDHGDHGEDGGEDDAGRGVHHEHGVGEGDHGTIVDVRLADLRHRYLDRAGEGRIHIGLASKINAAYEKGAAAILIVNDPASFAPGSDEDRVRPFRQGLLGVTSSLPAVHLTAAAATELLEPLGFDLARVQREIDGTMEPRSGPVAAAASLRVETEREIVATVNVVGVLRGSDPALAHEHVIVGAHMDHVGLGLRSGSLGGADAAGQIHNGADDNASGTAAVLELARVLADRSDELRRTVVFIAFGAEEWGLLGSRHYVEAPLLPLESCVAMLNMDMIGRSKDGYVSVGGVGTGTGLTELVAAAGEDLDTPLAVDTSEKVAGNSDHFPFWQRDIPILNLFTGLHEDYHRPGDDPEKINLPAAVAVANLCGELTLRLAGDMPRPRFVAAEPESPVADAEDGEEEDDPHADASAAAGPRIYFGSMPDYAYQEDDGTRIQGTREGSPAEKCGLRSGDLIVAMQGRTIRNVEDYAMVLFACKPGQEISLTVRRGEALVELTATIEARGGDA